MKEIRVPCPYCKELIHKEAIKCRFCGESLTSQNKISSSLRTQYWVWFSSLVLFYIALIFIRKASISDATQWLIILGLIALFGIFAFLYLLTHVLTSLQGKAGKWYGLCTLVTFIAFFALLFYTDPLEAKMIFLPPKAEGNTQQVLSTEAFSTPQATIMPVQQKATLVNNPNLIDCTGPDGKHLQITQRACDDFNASWGNKKTTNTEEVISDLITCKLSFGTYSVTKEQCADAMRKDTNPSGAIQSQVVIPTNTNSGNMQNNAPNSTIDNAAYELVVRQHQECLQQADTTYRSQLSYCQTLSYYGDPRLIEGCVSKADQQYVRDKGACN